MVVNRGDIKRKRKDDPCFNMLEESPKRTKVHAQRKFAQGSNVSSPVITPVKEIERQERSKDVLPEPIELLPMKRPNTEDFLTFLCFRGTPILPPNLNFFNGASMMDSPLKINEPKTTYPKNGPILTTAPSKCQDEKPFVAFGVRKRADPVVISKQMDRKRRHALALQALRRKYQEQKMAKIRAVTISKLSEKVTNKNVVRTRSVTKNEIASKKSVIQKTDIKVISTKHITTKTAIKQPVKSKMCLRSFRGRYIHRELNIQHRKRPRGSMGNIKSPSTKNEVEQKEKSSSEFSSDDDEPLMKSVKPKSPKKTSPSTVKKQKKTVVENNIRLTRSHNKLAQSIQLQQRKQTFKHRRIITRLSSMMMTSSNQRIRNKIVQSSCSNVIRNLRRSVAIKRNCKQSVTQMRVRSSRQQSTIKSTIEERSVSTTKTRSSARMADKPATKQKDQQKENVCKKEETPKNIKEQGKIDLDSPKKSVGTNEKENDAKTIKKSNEKAKIEANKPKITKNIPHQPEDNNTSTGKKNEKIEKPSVKPTTDEKSNVTMEKQTTSAKAKEIARQSSEPSTRRKVDALKKSNEKISSNSRPSRKTKEAAAIYMELLGHKLVNENEVYDDDESIHSFPELPNARKTEQRENELKAKAKSKVADKKDLPASSTGKTNNSKEEKEIVKKTKASVTVQSTPATNKSKNQNQDSSKKNDKTLNTPNAKQEPCEKKEPIQEEQKTQKIKGAEEKPTDKKSNSTSGVHILTVKQEECFSEKRKDECKIYKELNPNNTIPKTHLKTLKRQTSVTESDFDKAMALMLQGNNLATVYDNSKSPDSLKKIEKSDVEDSASNVKNKKHPISGNNIAALDQNFSDSDEEPLSNLTKSKEKAMVQSENQESEVALEQRKIERSKRDCVKKKGHNYLPFSSSDDEEKYFHGFVKTELKIPKNETIEKCPQHSLPSSDLSCKDVSRRYGKGKVNMSNEQIEKWLNDSAMAGMNIKKEEDDLLKFEDERRTPPSLVEQPIQSLPSTIAKLNSVQSPASMINTIIKIEDKSFNKTITMTNKENEECLSINSSTPEKSIGDLTNVGPALVTPPKNLPAERKTIFKKEKSIPIRNVNAFSANNECSVYAFEADNEDSTSVSTPFRRPCRRPSSTATSRSEDDSKLMDDVSKHSAGAIATALPATTGKFRFPTALRGDFKLTNKQESPQSVHDDTNNALQTNLDVHTFTDTSNSEPPSVSEDADHQIFCPSSIPSSNKHTSPEGSAKMNSAKTTAASGNLQKIVPSKSKLTARAGAAQLHLKLSANHDRNMFPPSTSQKGGKSDPLNKFAQKPLGLDPFEDAKYKIPSSPSASSSSSTKLASRRQTGKNRNRLMDVCAPINVSDFPNPQHHAQIVEAPAFHPTEKEFQDPLDYIEKIRSKAEKFGICRIIPPANFKPECKVSDDMRFTAYNQYVHKMLHRWGPNFKELMAIRKYLETQKITLTHPPWIGGMEIDLPRLYQTVQLLGGLKEVIEKKKWSKVSESMKIPKSAQDRVTKLDDIYCKYLLPYDTLSPAEREKLFDEVETEWAKRESKTLLKAQRVSKMDSSSGTDADSDSDNESEECIVKGRNMALNAFYRIARNTMSMWFKAIEPAAEEAEQEFWKHVTLKNNHICVHSGSIDSGNWGYGFPVSKNSPFARHAWNLKVLTNNSGSVLRSMG
ncbi:hypothetical protein AMK59_5177, partial [Oryctes borbonicus]